MSGAEHEWPASINKRTGFLPRRSSRAATAPAMNASNSMKSVLPALSVSLRPCAMAGESKLHPLRATSFGAAFRSSVPERISV